MAINFRTGLDFEAVEKARAVPRRDLTPAAAEGIVLQSYTVLTGLLHGLAAEKSGAAIWIGPNDTSVVMEVKEELSYEDAKKLLNMTETDLIECVYPMMDEHHVSLLIDEEGKLKNLPVNLISTFVFNSTFGAGTDVIVGEALVLFGLARWT